MKMKGGGKLKIGNTKKEWVTPELVEFGNIASITKGGTGWKTNGLGDDFAAQQLTPFQSTCCK